MDTDTCTVNSYSASAVPLCACVVVPYNVWCYVCTDKENGPQKAYSCFLILPHFGLAVVTVWGLTSNAWRENGPSLDHSAVLLGQQLIHATFPPALFHKGHVTQTSTRQSVSPHLTAIHRKVKDPAHNVLSKTFMYALHVHLHKLFGDTSRSRDQLPSSVWEEMVHCRCCQVIKRKQWNSAHWL